MRNNLDKFGGEIGERYTIIRRYNYGKEFNVYKAYEREKPRAHYVIKYCKTKDTFERELRVLELLKDAYNIVQMIDHYSMQMVIVCECALYDLEALLGHQGYSQRHEEKGNIIMDIVSGLLELHNHNIVHTELAPKNIMFFQGKDGYSECWKLIGFDASCLVDKDYVNIVTNYSAPEVIRAHEKKTKITANFAMDMFSFGLVLYFLETGQHYLDESNEARKEEVISAEYLSVSDVHDGDACYVISKLLDKNVSKRMTLEKFMQTIYYTGEPTVINKKYTEYDESDDSHLYEINERYAKLTQETFQVFFEKYHNKMEENLKIMNDKVDRNTMVVGNLTKKIPQLLLKVKNWKIPRSFIIMPDRKDWKKPESLLRSKPFRLYFVCESKDQWHVPEQKGYKILETPQFIKKYGPWVNLCLQLIMGSKVFPQNVFDMLSTVFNHGDLMQHFKEIIDTVEICVRTIPDEDPDFVPLSSKHPHQIINFKGLRELKKFLDTKESADIYGGLVQCIDEETQDILWLCEEHMDQVK